MKIVLTGKVCEEIRGLFAFFPYYCNQMCGTIVL